jgi:hypothetical protein
MTPECDLVVAAHEAGHALYALARGIPIVSVSIVEDGRSAGRVFSKMPMPTIADARPGSRWLDLYVSRAVAGDRAERRLVDHYREGASGGHGCDLDQAVAALEAVYARGDVTPELERLVADVDHLFALPAMSAHLERLTDALLTSREMFGSEVYDVVVDGRCGALHPDGIRRCGELPPKHVAAPHFVRSSEGLPDYASLWQFHELPDRGSKTRGAPKGAHLCLLRVFDPIAYPPPQQRTTTRDIATLQATIADPTVPRHRKDIAARQHLRALATRVHTAPRNVLPEPEYAEYLDVQARHEAACSPAEAGTDASLWCPSCAFEWPVAPTGTWRYLGVTERLVVERDTDTHWWAPLGLPVVLASASLASSWVKAQRMTGGPDHCFRVWRVLPEQSLTDEGS